MLVTKMLKKALLVSLLSLAGLAAATATAQATTYTLWIHGRNSGTKTQAGNYADFSYWGSSSTEAGVNKKAVNWDGVGRVADQNYRIRDALDCFCTGTNWCYVAVHSAGDLHLGYALAKYGTSARYRKNATPNTGGVCGNSDGTTQTGWNIKSVYVASGASGGSELADLGYWAVSDTLSIDLVTTTARAMYNHNTTQGLTFYRYAGAAGTLYSAILPGQDDEAVSYHSTGGVAGTTGSSYCNPSDWFCNDLSMGIAACEGGATKWSYHSLSFRDDGEAYNHYSAGSWLGIIGRTRSDVVTLAK